MCFRVRWNDPWTHTSSMPTVMWISSWRTEYHPFFSRIGSNFCEKKGSMMWFCWKMLKIRYHISRLKRCCFSIFSAKSGNLGTLKPWGIDMSWWLSMLQEEKSFGSTHKPIEPLGIKSHWAISFHRSESDNHILFLFEWIENDWLYYCMYIYI